MYFCNENECVNIVPILPMNPKLVTPIYFNNESAENAHKVHICVIYVKFLFDF